MTKQHPYPKVGNGGFSLRRLSTMTKLLSEEVLGHYNINDSNIFNILLNNKGNNSEEDGYSIMEDVWFCVYLHDRYDFNILSPGKAYSFSWDMNPDIIIRQIFIKYEFPASLIGKGVNDNEYKTFKNIVRTPEFIEDFKKFNLFGCHATIKNIDVWSNIIDEYKEIYAENPKFIEDMIEELKINKFRTGKIVYNFDQNK